MSTITATMHNEDKYRTPITSPDDNALKQAYNNHREITITLKEVPIGQHNFVVGTQVTLKISPDINAQGTVSRVDGPTKYSIRF